jgi:copper(I)-binding protein
VIKYYLLAAMLWSGAAQAGVGLVQVSEAWARATVAGQDSAAVALHIVSRKDARIIAVNSPVAASAKIHSMTHENGMMKMRALDDLPLAANKEVSLGSDGNHLMLVGLKKQLNGGDSVPLTITVQFDDKHTEKIEVKALVKPVTESHEGHMHHD